jgi:hypothetical protein
MIERDGIKGGDNEIIDKEEAAKTGTTHFPIKNLINGHRFEIEFLIGSWQGTVRNIHYTIRYTRSTYDLERDLEIRETHDSESSPPSLLSIENSPTIKNMFSEIEFLINDGVPLMCTMHVLINLMDTNRKYSKSGKGLAEMEA